MVEVVPFEDPANYGRVEQRIRKLWKEGQVAITTHAQQRMKERKVDITDVQQVLRYGSVVDHSFGRDLWRYVVSGKTVEGTRTTVVVEIDGAMIIVTVRR